jgi:hypothetical protein
MPLALSSRTSSLQHRGRIGRDKYYTPLNSSQAATIFPRPKSEGRKSIAQCASTGNRAQDALAAFSHRRAEDARAQANRSGAMAPFCENRKIVVS